MCCYHGGADNINPRLCQLPEASRCSRYLWCFDKVQKEAELISSIAYDAPNHCQASACRHIHLNLLCAFIS
jgi:hypothetical protein